MRPPKKSGEGAVHGLAHGAGHQEEVVSCITPRAGHVSSPAAAQLVARCSSLSFRTRHNDDDDEDEEETGWQHGGRQRGNAKAGTSLAVRRKGGSSKREEECVWISVDIENDGYFWRKYGEKIVQSEPSAPRIRSYFKCGDQSVDGQPCPSRKTIDWDVRTRPMRGEIHYSYEHNHPQSDNPRRSIRPMRKLKVPMSLTGESPPPDSPPRIFLPSHLVPENFLPAMTLSSDFSAMPSSPASTVQACGSGQPNMSQLASFPQSNLLEPGVLRPGFQPPESFTPNSPTPKSPTALSLVTSTSASTAASICLDLTLA